MVAGLIIATLQFVLDQNKETFSEDFMLSELTQMHAIYLFPIIFGFSLLGSFLGTYFGKPTDMAVLKSFYKNVRPWGWWRPVYQELKNEDEGITPNREFGIDMINCAIGIIWQSSMIVLTIYLVIRDYPKAFVAFVVFLVASIILKYTWLDRVNKIAN